VSLPTTQWGNPSDVYATVPTQGDGPVLGNWQMYFVDGSTIQFVQNTSAGALTLYYALGIGGTTWASTYSVLATGTANTQYVVGVNDQSGISVSASYAFWMKTRGLMFPLVAASVAAEKVVCSSATAGTLQAVTAGTSLQFDIVNTQTVGSGGAASSPCLRVQ
jgi:hypothetical protein